MHSLIRRADERSYQSLVPGELRELQVVLLSLCLLSQPSTSVWVSEVYHAQRGNMNSDEVRVHNERTTKCGELCNMFLFLQSFSLSILVLLLDFDSIRPILIFNPNVCINTLIIICVALIFQPLCCQNDPIISRSPSQTVIEQLLNDWTRSVQHNKDSKGLVT